MPGALAAPGQSIEQIPDVIFGESIFYWKARLDVTELVEKTDDLGTQPCQFRLQ
ncbi:hypothetical protein BURPS1710A_A3040 [Burkholderia pseudomallei 1710a]|uniref:Uncharacterized protein n=1 Tax=Burkholderia pseudomallei 1710a TaxID=320371 RepID=A0A0E1VS52_BURPE|nr:hypothetical protein BURPS1710A_A3040 [Burkholderia pseudomallei 1710a]